MNMHTHTCTHTLMRAHTLMHMHTHSCTCTHTHAHIHARTQVCTHTHSGAHKCTHISVTTTTWELQYRCGGASAQTPVSLTTACTLRSSGNMCYQTYMHVAISTRSTPTYMHVYNCNADKYWTLYKSIFSSEVGMQS